MRAAIAIHSSRCPARERACAEEVKFIDVSQDPLTDPVPHSECPRGDRRTQLAVSAYPPDEIWGFARRRKRR
jgi:hypothetical protein